MTWSELGYFLNSQRLALTPRPMSEFAQIGEKAADTFKSLAKTTRKPLNKAVREFAKTKVWPALTDEQTLILYFRLGNGVDLALALSTCTTGIFPTLQNQDFEMIQWTINDAWEYPGIPHTLRAFAEKRRDWKNDPTRN